MTYIMTEERKNKLREMAKEQWANPESRQKKLDSILARRHLTAIQSKERWANPEYKNRMTALFKLSKKPMTLEQRLKISQARKNKPLSEQHKLKIKETWANPHIRQIRIDKIKIACSTEEYLSRAREQNSGENNPCWQGGISFEPYSINFNKQLKEKIRFRDGYICQICNNKQDDKRRLTVHHINYDKKDTSDNNLISVCIHCHQKTNFNRNYWQTYLSEFIANKYSTSNIKMPRS
jgi:hypothetical protein